MKEHLQLRQKQVCNVHQNLMLGYKQIQEKKKTDWNCYYIFPEKYAILNFCVVRFLFKPLCNFPLVSKTEKFPLSKKFRNIFAFAELCGTSWKLILLHKKLSKSKTFPIQFPIALNSESNFFDSNLCIRRIKLILRNSAELKICFGDLHNWWVSCGSKHFISIIKSLFKDENVE